MGESMSLTKLMVVTRAAANWFSLMRHIKNIQTEDVIYFEGKPYIVHPASPGDVERLTHKAG